MSAVHTGKILTCTVGSTKLYQTLLISVINVSYTSDLFWLTRTWHIHYNWHFETVLSSHMFWRFWILISSLSITAWLENWYVTASPQTRWHLEYVVFVTWHWHPNCPTARLDLSHVYVLTAVDFTVIPCNEPLRNKIKLIKTTKLNVYCDIKLQGHVYSI